MYAMARLIQTLHVFDKLFIHLGMPVAWIFHFAIILSAVIVLCYIFLGGLTSAIYNEVLQFFLIVAGFLPLVWVGLKKRRRLERFEGDAAIGVHAFLAGHGQRAHQSARRGFVRPRGRPRLRSLLRLLVY